MTALVVTVTLNPAIDKTLTIPKLRLGELNRVQDVQVDPGGKGINVTKVLNQFGVKVTATGLIAGTEGRYLLDDLEKNNISVHFHHVQGQTRTNLKIVDVEAQLTTEINESGFVATEKDIQLFRSLILEKLQGATYLVLGGSLPQGVQESIYKELILLANELGIRTILDAEGEAMVEGLKAKPYAIKPNLYELEELVGHSLKDEVAIIKAGHELIHSGISIVAISRGKQGSIILSEKKAYKVTPFEITPKSTVGAGDAMVGAMVYTFLNELSLKDTAIWATTAGTVTASKTGTQVCTLGEVQQSISRVQVSQIY